MVSTNKELPSSRDEPALSLDRLIADARAGSAESLDKLIEQLSRHLWAELGGGRKPRGLGPSHGLSDLIQDTLVRVREKFGKFERHTFAEFKQWARAVLHRRRQEWIRNYRSRNADTQKEKIWLAIRTRIASESGGRPDGDPAQRREECERAFAAFGRLKPNERFIINLRSLEGLRYKEIGAMTGWSEEAARKAYDRAIAHLKELFQANGKL
jgi:RNA polymerase sigma factor (sigma-70 family)